MTDQTQQEILVKINTLMEIHLVYDERERRNTLTLALISQMISEILAELRKPAPESSPLVDALRQLITLIEQQTGVLTHIESVASRVEIDTAYVKNYIRR